MYTSLCMDIYLFSARYQIRIYSAHPPNPDFANWVLLYLR